MGYIYRSCNAIVLSEKLSASLDQHIEKVSIEENVLPREGD